MKRTLSTVEEVIFALGGPTAVASAFGVTQPAVSNWILRNEIPAGWHLRVYVKLRELGHRVHPQVFGLESLDALEGPPERPRSKLRPRSAATAA